MQLLLRVFYTTLVSLTLLLILTPNGAIAPAHAESARAMERSARKALASLYKSSPGAQSLARDAKGILIFPEIIKGGFVVGAQYGKGVLFKGGAVAGYYNTASASFGLQAGIQKFGYALFFMTEEDLGWLKRSEGWEIGVGPMITIVDVGLANTLSTTTSHKGIYAFFFQQRGLMGGLSLQGTKISRIEPHE